MVASLRSPSVGLWSVLVGETSNPTRAAKAASTAISARPINYEFYGSKTKAKEGEEEEKMEEVRRGGVVI